MNAAGSVPAAAGIVARSAPVIRTTTLVRRKRRDTADTLETSGGLEITLSGERSVKRVTRSFDFPVTLPVTLALASVKRFDVCDLVDKADRG
jgi:hypothetical protein